MPFLPTKLQRFNTAANKNREHKKDFFFYISIINDLFCLNENVIDKKVADKKATKSDSLPLCVHFHKFTY